MLSFGTKALDTSVANGTVRVPHPPLVNGYPVSIGEPLVSFDVVHSVFKVAEAFGEIHLQQVSQQVLQVGAEV